MTKVESVLVDIDHRESQSGIPGLLASRKVKITSGVLKAGDYIINNEIIVERKTNEDFIQSIVQNRIFRQCAKIRNSQFKPVLIIEGDLFATQHKISKEAIRGTLISISVSWQIPILLSENPYETCEILLNMDNQLVRQDFPVLRRGYKPKRIKNRQLFFLQGLPGVGPKLALKMIKRFGSVQNSLNAPLNELRKLPGIGIQKATKIKGFLETNFGTSKNNENHSL